MALAECNLVPWSDTLPARQSTLVYVRNWLECPYWLCPRTSADGVFLNVLKYEKHGMSLVKYAKKVLCISICLFFQVVYYIYHCHRLQKTKPLPQQPALSALPPLLFYVCIVIINILCQQYRSVWNWLNVFISDHFSSLIFSRWFLCTWPPSTTIHLIIFTWKGLQRRKWAISLTNFLMASCHVYM